MQINFKKQIKWFAAIGLLGILTACSIHHKNPLSRINEDDSAKFLVDASRYAEIKIKTNLSNHGYENCMDQKLDAKTCGKLFTEMLVYAKTQRLFKSLTLNDLTDVDVWQNLEEVYKGKVFVALPLLESAYQ